MRWVVIALLSGFFNCNPSKPTPEPTPFPTYPPWHTEKLVPFESRVGSISVQLPPQHMLAYDPGVRDYVFSFSSVKHITRIWSFIGVDPGNHGEFAISLAAGGLRIYQRSMHKETDGIYDAWEFVDVDFRAQDFALGTVAHASIMDGNIGFELIFEVDVEAAP